MLPHSTSNWASTTSLFASSSQSYPQDTAAPQTLPSVEQVPSMAHFSTSLELDRPPMMPPVPPEDWHHIMIEQLVTQWEGEPSWLNEPSIEKCMCFSTPAYSCLHLYISFRSAEHSSESPFTI